MQQRRKAGFGSTFTQSVGPRAQLRRVQHALFLLAQSLHRYLRWISTHHIVRERAREPASRFALLALFSSSSTSPPCSSSLFTARFAQRRYNDGTARRLSWLCPSWRQGCLSTALALLRTSLSFSLSTSRSLTLAMVRHGLASRRTSQCSQRAENEVQRVADAAQVQAEGKGEGERRSSERG